MTKTAKTTKPAGTVLPSFLNFNRSISPSEGILSGIHTNGKTIPVEILSRGIRGAIGNYSSIYKADKPDSSANIAKQLDPKNANLQQIESAYLPNGAERILLQFSLIVQDNSLKPSGCNSPEFYQKLKALTQAYDEKGGFDFLAQRYLWNILNGRTLWRNRMANNKQVVIEVGDKVLAFDVDNMPLNRFSLEEMPTGFEEIAQLIANALSGKSDALFMTVSISGRLPMGAEIYPSQEFLPDADKSRKDVGKVLSSINVEYEGRNIRQATMHSQKIGNAIRVIDEWHGEMDDFGVTPIEVYGYVQSRSDALRIPGKARDIYVLLKNIDEITQNIKKAADLSEVEDDVHYMVAVLIRGGVFSGEAKAK